VRVGAGSLAWAGWSAAAAGRVAGRAHAHLALTANR